MNKVTREVIDNLTERPGGSRLTIYMPTNRISTPPNIQEDQTRYKNLIREGYQTWSKQVDEAVLKDVWNELESKLSDETFWGKSTGGLAIFADTSGVEYYHLPIESEERVCVGDTFDVTPLHIVLSYTQPYYVLALAMHNSKLFKGDAYGLKPVAIDFPSSPEDALNIDEMFSGSNTQRGYEGPASSNYSISTHGAGDSNHAGQEERLQYFRIIDGMIAKSKEVDTKLPIVIAATEAEASDYKNTSKLDTLLDSYVHGNHTVSQLHELHALTWEVVRQEIVITKAKELVEQFNELKGIKKASSDVPDIKEAVAAGRVDTLFLCAIDHTNDSVAETSDTNAPLIRFDEKYEKSGVADLVKSVIAQGGKIVGITQELFNVPSMMGALYRY